VPKRSEIIRDITKAAKAAGLKFVIVREGKGHTIYSLDGLLIPIGRHNEFGNRYAETVNKECEPKLGKGRWR
jgi:hypothetical protein